MNGLDVVLLTAVARGGGERELGERGLERGHSVLVGLRQLPRAALRRLRSSLFLKFNSPDEAASAPEESVTSIQSDTEAEKKVDFLLG